MLLITSALAAPPTPGTDEDEQNRRLLEKARGEPAYYAYLRESLRQFLALPPEQQERIRQLDHDLYRQDPATEGRLKLALERYADWYERLPDADRQRVDGAPDAKSHLAVIKQIRRRQWEEHLPRAYHERLAKATDAERTALLQEWRQKERHHPNLVLGLPPARLAEFQLPVQAFVHDFLRPLLSPAEEERLWKAEGEWPLYPATLVELSEKHPFMLPAFATGPTWWKDLPPEVQIRLELLDAGLQRRLHEVEGRWPEFALTADAIVRARNIKLPRDLGPCSAQDLVKHRHFITKLEKELTPAEKAVLQKAEGHWPLYPHTLFQLAHKHKLTIPGGAVRVHLPGPREFWDKLRNAENPSK